MYTDNYSLSEMKTRKVKVKSIRMLTTTSFKDIADNARNRCKRS